MLQPSLEYINQLFEQAVKAHPAAIGDHWQILDYACSLGGDTHHGYLLHSNGPSFFVKLNDPGKVSLFNAEFQGLKALRQAHTRNPNSIRACKPICVGHCHQFSYLMLEGLDLQPDGDWYLAGQQLAELHHLPAGQRFGFEHPSYCGITYQPNSWESCWSEFFARQRIGHQLSLLRGKPLEHPDIQTLVNAAREFLREWQPQPALVHGDLWRGNISFHREMPVIFDPACYYADAETDLAMSELFGRFPEAFYQGYASVSPIDQDYPRRRPLYQLYHLLNHANLFGGHYRQEAEQQLKILLH